MLFLSLWHCYCNINLYSFNFLAFFAFINRKLMNYTDSYTCLKDLFDIEKKDIKIPWSDISICNLNYQSKFSESDFFNSEDHEIKENIRFTYPVFKPSQESLSVILLLHGLNERNWSKYLTWAHSLAENTSSYVVLFPISFHINRSPSLWSNPREMATFMNERRNETGDNNMLSFANAALSSRLAKEPLRFFNSGYQTATDLIDLLVEIRDGRHEIIPGGCKLNIFAYSIGAFLGEILMLANPQNLFSDSKIFLFCGGSFFSGMNGRSKLIMDNHSFTEVFDFYMKSFENIITGENKIFKFIRSSQLGAAFRSMLDKKILKDFRESRLAKISDQIRGIALEKDTVIPAKSITETLNEPGKEDVVNVNDFPFPYSHENPFPIFKTPLAQEVDRNFDLIFSKASAFLS